MPGFARGGKIAHRAAVKDGESRCRLARARNLLRGLKDDREIWVGDDRVTDVVSHPAFAGAAKGMAAVFDLQYEAADDCLIPDPETGEPINVSHMIPRSPEDLQAPPSRSATHRRTHGRRDGAHAGLHERDLRRVRRLRA